MDVKLPADTSIGAVSLTVRDLQRSIDFYQGKLGFELHTSNGGSAWLGDGSTELLQLVEMPSARQIRGTTGLYHFAILVPSRYDLARSLRRILELRLPVQGFADHWVSEAIYLPDPDGNGIEIYRDRPESEWPRKNGQLQMATEPLDLRSVLSELGQDPPSWSGLAAGTRIGHVHLHVANLSRNEEFYRQMLGFDLIMHYGSSAAFLSAGGYHHHVGINTWAGESAPPPPPDAAGLRWYSIQFGTREALQSAWERLQSAGVQLEKREGGYFATDPSENGFLLTAKPQAASRLEG